MRKWPSLAEFGHFLAKNGSKIDNRTIFMFQILINREEKENFFFKILKMEKRKRMKIQFFRASGSERGQYFSRFLEISRDSRLLSMSVRGGLDL